jgi:uncharacterized protein
MEKYELLLNVTKNSLKTLEHLLDKAESHVKERGIEESTLLTASLAPDMFNFTKQIQIASDDARRNLRLLAGKEHVRMEDTETTIAELRTRIQKTREVVNELTSSDFSEADTRKITLYWMGENYVEGNDFVQQLGIPNFMFHVAMAYAILRKEGVSIGKSDFITTLNMKPKTE